MIAATAMPVLGEGAFLAWLDRAAPGERIAYHEGHLGCDRAFRISHLPEPVRAEINRVAVCAMDLAGQGRVVLAQRRVGEDRVAYLAIKATPPKAKGGRA
ncbi:hypothetical protein H261_10482 [Paramagnetospirillum caucaseum]|uniref:Uncharacterized protein n=1 Tax=Paramagnetospirillum caucaseum TaxID=1244869 RepID=M3ABU3_9PROT|nr:hypothetical protein [Paramagnetospirillum caucaseum]EME69969.1 hypothetical protein H261_10482 [Paramagnetospirillum caucaseum]